MDSLSRALMARRGRSLDPSMLTLTDEEMPMQGAPTDHPMMDKELGIGAGAVPPALDLPQAPVNAAPLPGDMTPSDDDPAMMDQIAGNASQSEYNDLKSMGSRPRSLGERVKMSALAQKYEGKK